MYPTPSVEGTEQLSLWNSTGCCTRGSSARPGRQIGQSLDPTGFRAIRTTGGWADVWYQLTNSLTMHIGYGIDNPRNGDVGQFLDDNLMPVAGQRSLNQVIWTNLMWDVSDEFDIGFEVSHRKTDYIAPSISNNAMVYHFRARLKF